MLAGIFCAVTVVAMIIGCLLADSWKDLNIRPCILILVVALLIFLVGCEVRMDMDAQQTTVSKILFWITNTDALMHKVVR